jgi:hypothetical protein
MTFPPTRTLASVHVDDVLPELVVPITRTLVVAGALASRDYQDVHHDHVLAEARGSKDIFMNILTTNGLVGRYVTDWAGPGAVLRDVSIRLGVPNHPGDTMTFTGHVSDVDHAGGTATVALRGANKAGDHVTGTVVVALPPGEAS